MKHIVAPIEIASVGIPQRCGSWLSELWEYRQNDWHNDSELLLSTDVDTNRMQPSKNDSFTLNETL